MEGYKNLTTYIFAVVIHDLTIIFCRRYLDRRSRTIDQMEQSSRYGKQNIAEDYSLPSFKGYIKLLEVACSSLKEVSTKKFVSEDDFGKKSF